MVSHIFSLSFFIKIKKKDAETSAIWLGTPSLFLRIGYLHPLQEKDPTSSIYPEKNTRSHRIR